MIILLRTHSLERSLTHTMHSCAGADVRLSIRHFIQWEDGSPSPVVLPTPSASKTDMQQVIDKCQKINDKTAKVKTRFQYECQNCVHLQSKLHRASLEHQHQV